GDAHPPFASRPERAPAHEHPSPKPWRRSLSVRTRRRRLAEEPVCADPAGGAGPWSLTVLPRHRDDAYMSDIRPAQEPDPAPDAEPQSAGQSTSGPDPRPG